MQNGTAYDWLREEKIAWTLLEPHEKEAAMIYIYTLQTWECVVTPLMTMEMITIGERVKHFCPVLSIPDRLIPKERP